MGPRPDAGLLLAFEGIDGSGKTTQARLLAEALVRRGREVVSTKEPTSGPNGRRLRESAHVGRLPADEELETFIADRREHVERLVRPALETGKVVVVDRYYFSTAAYQGARGLDSEEILLRNEAFAPCPDRVFLLRIPVEIALERIRARGDRANLFERREALEAVLAAFDGLSRPCLCPLDGTRGIDELHDEILTQVVALLDGRNTR